ncbi:MAG: substrate-binding domain-containing protein [Desulfoprunum sp.]|uniref:substrate-binding domain-containing protein n=1 Tax=Desulfoprunum sp. TaxID=2020866 RepID=UPI003C70746E
MKRLSWVVIGAFLLVSASIGGAMAEDKVLTMSTTTSTESSGLLDVLLPEFKKDTGIEVKVLAKGTGAALKDGMDGNVDVVFVHAKKKEAEFVEKGFGTQRYAVMHNDFIIVGPPADPAGIKGSKDSIEALEKIAAAKAPFISRGDDSGTHTKEQEIWAKTSLKLEETSQKLVISGKEAQVVAKKPENSDVWYYSIGQGMGKTLTFADEKNAYAIADRGTYIAYKWGKTPAVDLEILFEGDETLANPYGVIPVNPKKFPHVKYDLAQQFADWLMSARGQKVIADFKLEGKQLFFPDAIN